MLWERKKGFCLLSKTIRSAPSYAWRESKDGGPKKRMPVWQPGSWWTEAHEQGSGWCQILQHDLCFVSLSHATCTAGVMDGDHVQMRFAQHVVIIDAALHLLTVKKVTKKRWFLKVLASLSLVEAEKKFPFLVIRYLRMITGWWCCCFVFHLVFSYLSCFTLWN